jgi:hypothetical protein
VEDDLIYILCQFGSVLAVLFNIWVSFRVMDDWFGALGAVVGVVLFPITTIVLPLAMLFYESEAAGPLALWPGIILIGVLQRLAARPDVAI